MELRPYQKEDVAYLSGIYSVGIFNEQRTGKTPTALSLIKKVNQWRKINKVLIIAPASTLYNWKREYELWLGRPCAICKGTPSKRSGIITNWKDGLVISYDSLKTTKRSEGHIAEILKQKPDCVIVDEVHRIKDRNSATTRAVWAFDKLTTKIVLSGTPAPNYPHEIWSILRFLYPTTFKSYWKFIEEYFETNLSYAGGNKHIEIGGFRSKDKEQKLLRFLNKMSIVRKRKDVMPWLPAKDYQRVYLSATPQQRKYLDELAEYFEIEGTNIVTQGVLDRLIRYRQICLHPGILSLKGSSPKLDFLKEYVKDYPDKSIIIFTKFTTFIDILQESFKDAGFITGQTTLKKRQDIMEDFQQGKLKVLIAQIDTCKEGLTLDRAETIIFTDKFPPAADIQQAEDRFVATTKEKANKEHTIIELILQDTYDQQLYELLQKNMSAIDIVNNFKNYLKETAK